MTKKHYVLKCNACGAPAADCVRICPYCGASTGFEDLGLGSGVKRNEDGGMLVSDGAQVVIGRPDRDPRPCPFCGATVKPTETHCAYCSEKVVIETMKLATLVISGGSLVVGAGGSMEIIGRRETPVHKGAQHDDVAKIKAAVMDGYDPNHPDAKGKTPLHYAATHGNLDAARYLLSLGAIVDQTSDDGRTALHECGARGRTEIAKLLLAVGASKGIQDQRNKSAGDLARERGDQELGTLL